MQWMVQVSVMNIWQYARYLMMVITVTAACNHAWAKSLYDPDHYRALAADTSALVVGDSVTVVIVETSSAEAAAGQDASRSLGVSGSIGKTTRTELGSVVAEAANGRAGSTSRNGRLTAQITTTVIERDENGRLYVEGEQEIVIDKEKQLINVAGWVRPFDIDANNIVLSTRLTDAKIEYTGKGDLSRNKRSGIIYWFLSLFRLI